jgi:hypothetical protein
MTFDYSTLLERGWKPYQKPVNRRVLMLCPYRDFKYIPDGTYLEAIDGEILVKGIDSCEDEQTWHWLYPFGVRVRVTE